MCNPNYSAPFPLARVDLIKMPDPAVAANQAFSARAEHLELVTPTIIAQLSEVHGPLSPDTRAGSELTANSGAGYGGPGRRVWFSPLFLFAECEL